MYMAFLILLDKQVNFDLHLVGHASKHQRAKWMSKGKNKCIMTCFIYSLLFVFTTSS